MPSCATRNLSIRADVERFFDRPVCNAYLDAKRFVEEAGYASEIDWQERAATECIDEQRILREFAWVVLNSGMREATVRQRFGAISNAFRGWSSAQDVWRNRDVIRREAIHEFRHAKKIDAIIVAAGYLRIVGADAFWRRLVQSHELDFLTRLPFMGPATSRHLAKNLGLQVAKPDRHLQRIAAVFGVDTETLCRTISEITGDPVPVVDLVLWRFATLHKRPSNAFLRICQSYVEPVWLQSRETSVQ